MTAGLSQPVFGFSSRTHGKAYLIRHERGRPLSLYRDCLGEVPELTARTLRARQQPRNRESSRCLALNTDPGTNFDQTDFSTGGLTIQSGVTANLVFDFAGSTVDWTDAFWISNQEWLVFSGASSLSRVAGIFTTLNMGLDSLGNSLAPSQGIFSFTGLGNDVYLTYSAIPEPSTTLLLTAGLVVALFFRRR